MQSRVLAILIAVVLALVATAALVVYVNGADRRAIADQRPVVVLRGQGAHQGRNQREDAQNRGQIEKKEVPQQNAVSGSFRNVGQLEGKFAAVDIVKGEQPSRRAGSGPTRSRAGACSDPRRQPGAVDRAGHDQAGGRLRPRATTSAWCSRPNTIGTNTTKFLLQNVRVIAVGTTARTTRTAQGGGGRVNQGKGSQNLTAITLAIKKQHVENVVHAVESGQIYLTLMPRNAVPVPRSRDGISDGNVYPTEQG
jgi:pilus assembly protein CpaB